MDTRFWGKDGWKISHSIVARYPLNPTDKDKFIYFLFFFCFQFVLPCIYCRASFGEYFKKLPIIKYLESRESLCEWLYLMHNFVNDKLRKQGYNHNDDPDLQSVCKKYDSYVKEINDANCIEMPGFDFIYSVYFNYPLDTPEENLNERKLYYPVFLDTLIQILPFNVAKSVLMKYDVMKRLEEKPETRDNYKQLVYCLEKHLKDYINCKCIGYTDKCKYIEQYRAGCKGTQTVGTCRNPDKK